MRLLLVGIDFRAAPVEVRERLAFPGDEAGALAVALRGLPGVDEALVLSTCNRTELLVAYNALQSSDRVTLPGRMIRLAADTKGAATIDEDLFYVKEGADAVRHMLRVACGLESMIVGEGHILSQVKDAYRQACDAATNGALINKTMHAAFRAGKRARSETAIGRGAVSVSLAAVNRARRCLRDFNGRTVVILGAGRIARSTVEHLRKRGAARIIVVNRTLSRAVELAQRAGGDALPLSSLPWALAQADLVITAATADRPIVDRRMLIAVMQNRQYRRLVLVDVGVPRCVEAAAGCIENVSLCAIDDLREAVDRNLLARRREIPAVERIIGEEIADLYTWYRARPDRYPVAKSADGSSARSACHPRKVVVCLSGRTALRSALAPPDCRQ